MSSLKKHPAVSNQVLRDRHKYMNVQILALVLNVICFLFQLIPLYFCIGLGGIFATFYTIRLATCSPDVSWFNKKKAEPWNEYSNKQYKVRRAIRDCSQVTISHLALFISLEVIIP